MPIIPKGKQQKQVTNIDSTNHVLGMMLVFINGGSGGKLESKSDNSGTCFAGFQLENPIAHTIVFGVIFLFANSSTGNGPCLELLINI